MNDISPAVHGEPRHSAALLPARYYFWQPFHSRDPIPVNFGDDLFGKIAGKLIGREASTCAPDYPGRKIFIGGSTLGYAHNGDQVWGAGIRGGYFDPKIQHLKVHAVRGPLTAAILRERGIVVPFCHGDPGLLWPELFPEIGRLDPKWDCGVVPHFREWINSPESFYPPNVKIISPTRDALAVLDEIRQCRKIVASSLHGIICAEAIGIPVEPYKLDGPNAEPDFKYADYYAASGREWQPHASIAAALAGKFDRPPDFAVERNFLKQMFPNNPESGIARERRATVSVAAKPEPAPLSASAASPQPAPENLEAIGNKLPAGEERRRLSVIIPTCNRAALLQQSLESLAAQSLEPDAYEVIVVDDGSTDATPAVCQRSSSRANFRFVRQNNSGIAAAKNRGVEMARGDIVLFFDDDDVADPQLLAEHLKSHSEFPDENVAVLGYTGWHESIQADVLMDYIVGKGGFLFSYGALKHGQFYDYTYFWGGRSSCKRSLLLKHGLFNPVFTFGSEDIELGYRLASAAGLKVLYNNLARSHMIRPVQFDAFLARCRRQGKSQAWFSRLHPAAEVQKWCGRRKAEGIWEFLKIDFERQVRWARQLTEEANALGRQAGQTGSSPELEAHLKALIAKTERAYCRVFTAAKYQGLVEELQKLGEAPEPAAKPDGGESDAAKRILVIDLFIPVFNRASGSLRAFQLLKMMRELGHEVTFLSKYPQYADEYAPYLEELGIEVIAGDPLAMQASGAFDPCPLVNYDQLLGRRWDLAVISFWDNAEYYLPLLKKFCPETPVVVDTVDIVFLRKMREAELLPQPGAVAEAMANKEREIAVYRKADRLWVVTDADRDAIAEYVPGISIDVVSNIHARVEEQKTYAASKDLFFVGNFWHKPNVDAMAVFCHLVFPLIHAKRPDIKLKIAGDNAPPGLKRYESDAIQFLGHVPDLAGLLRSSRISIAPLRFGAGMKGKIGEALSWGVPVVTTTIGAEGMHLVDGEDALIANSPAAFADAVLRLYEDEALWTRLSRNGPVKVQNNWGCDIVKDRLAEALLAAMPNRPLASIIILVMNQLPHTRACLESIAAHTTMLHEVIVVDNASANDTREFLKEWQATHPNCVVIRNETNRGFAGGNNQAISIARGANAVLLNNDTVVTRGWLERLLEVFDRHPDTGIVGPVSNNVSGPQWVKEADYSDLQEMPRFAEQWTRNHRRQSFEVARAVGFCLVARREVVQAIGGLDERFGSGNFEDDDFCIRARLAGFRARVAQDVFIHHVGSQTFKGAKIDYRHAMQRNWNLFRAKWRMGDEVLLEKGYPVPTVLPKGVEIKIQLPRLEQTHKATAGFFWTQNSATAAVKLEIPGVARLGNLDKAKTLLGCGKFAEAWAAAAAAVKLRPFHPEAFLQLAETALAAGDGQGARLCAQRARDLAPGWRTARQFLSRPLKGNAKPEWLDPSSVLHPPSSPRLSVCLIVKNEEQFLVQCLKSVQGLAQQMIVVDTGSTDRTVEIAKSFGAEVHSFAWCDDFSAARNAALEHATGDWVLMLDADEELHAAEHARLQADMKRADVIAFRLPLINKGDEAHGRHCVPRLFRNAPGVYYYSRIHEQVFPSLIQLGKAWGLKTAIGTAELLHHGYAKEVVRDRNKVERNLKLLRQAVVEFPGDANLQMNLGLELVHSDDLQTGLVHYREAFRLMSAQPPGEVAPELREVLLTQFTCHLYKVRAHDEIVQALNSPLAKQGGLSASLHFALGLAFFELKQFREAAGEMRQCLAKRKQLSLAPINTDILTAVPHHCLALSLVKLGDAAEAEKAFKSGLAENNPAEVKLDYAKFLAGQNRQVEALQQLNELVAANSRNAAAWRLGGEIALISACGVKTSNPNAPSDDSIPQARPEFLEFARDWTGEAIRQLPEDGVIIAQRAEALLLSQQTTEALPLWSRAVNGQRPPRALAAQIICATAASQPVEKLRDAPEEAAVSRAFVDWYRRLVAAGAHDTVVHLNSRVEMLRPVLPLAAGVLDGVIAATRAN
jgi:GT2 family glycosyltransferase/glycosyltransferase involved in cell wall biosynthesis